MRACGIIPAESVIQPLRKGHDRAIPRRRPRPIENRNRTRCRLSPQGHLCAYGLKITAQTKPVYSGLSGRDPRLQSGKYKLYRKPGDTPLYVNSSSNHPPVILNKFPQQWLDDCQTSPQTAKYLQKLHRFTGQHWHREAYQTT